MNEPSGGAQPTVPSSEATPVAAARGFGRDAVVYGAGVVISRVISFLMLPIYTRYLTPVDYGLLQVLQITLDVTSIALSAGLLTGVMRFYLKAETEALRGSVMSTALLLLTSLNAIGTIALCLFAPWIARLTLSEAGPDGATLIRVAACTFAAEASIAVPLLYLQALRRPGWYMGATLAKLFLQLALNILLVVLWGWGAEGVLVGTLAATLALGAVLTPWMLRRTGVRFDRGAMRNLRRFGVPYQIATAGTFILTFGDRFFLEASHGLAAVGLYGLAYQFGFLLSGLVPQPFFRAWTPQRLALSSEPRPLRDAAYARSFLQLNLLQITVALGLTVFVRPFLQLMSAPEFHGAAVFVPVIVAAFVVQVWTDAVTLGIEVSEQTRYATFATWISVVVVLALYASLIPPFGGMGAAIATLIAALVRFGCMYHWSQRLWPVAWDWAPNLRLAGYAVACGIVGVALHPESFTGQLVTGGTLGLVYVAVLLADRPVGEDVRTIAAAVLSSARTALGGAGPRG